MPDTAVRDIELIEVGSLGKETLSNDAFLNLSYGISGAAIIALAATDHTLTLGASGEAMRFVLILTGTLTANVNVLVPAESRVYVVDNRTTGAFTVTFRPVAGGGVAVDQSARTLIYCDGSNVYPVASGTGGGGGSGAPTDASYLVGASHTLLSGERVVTDTSTVTWDLGTTGQARAVIPSDAITYGLIQNVAPTRLLGRFTAGAGDVQEITPGTGLTLDASGVLSVVAGGGSQPLDATLTALAGVTTAANFMAYFTGVDVAASTPLTPLARTLLDDTTQAAMQATLALVPGTNVQAHDATTAALAVVTTGADRLPFFTGVDTASTTTLTAFMRGLLDDPDAATARTTLGVTGGSTTLLGLSDVPDTYTGQAGKVLTVNTGETGTEFITPASGGGGDGHWARYEQAAGGELVWIIIPTVESDMLRLGTSTATPDASAPGTMRWSGADMECWKADAWVSMTASGGGGSSTLLGLSDVPDSYAGQAGKFLAVTTTEDAVEFVDAPTEESIVDSFWYWTSATTGAVSTGYMGISAGTPIDTIEMRIHEIPIPGGSMATALHRLHAGDLLAIQEVSTGDLMIRYLLTGIGTDQGAGQWTLPITHETDSGMGLMVNTQQYAVRLTYQSSGGGSSTLLGLSDVPDTYTGQAGKLLAVNPGETGTEFVTPAAGSSYTDEQAQDAIGAMLVDSATIALAYADATPALSASVIDGSIIEAKLGFSDVTTQDASTTAHGLLRKLSGTATQYLDGSGAWTTPAGGGETLWTRTAGGNTLLTACTAFWSFEEASGTRVDRIGSLGLTPMGGANLTQVAGRVGQAVGMNGTAATYLTMASAPATAMSTTTSVTVMAWVYVAALNGCAYVSKGNAGASASYEYLLAMHGVSTKFQFGIANGTTFQILQDTGPVPTLNAWHLVIGWFDRDASTLNLQVDNGFVVSVAATTTSYASAHPLEMGRHAGWSGSPSLNGRLDMPGIAKRVLTATERADLWNGGLGVDYPFPATGGAAGGYVRPVTSTDSLLLGATRLTTERLEVDGALKLGTALGTTDGTLRWTGTDMEARKGGAWVSMTGAGGQPLDATLTALAGLATGANLLPYLTGVDQFATTAFTAAGRTLAGAADAAAQRAALALGTMAQQNAASVAITGGVATFSDVQSNRYLVPERSGNDQIGLQSLLQAAGGTGRFGLYLGGDAPAYLNGHVGIKDFPTANARVLIKYPKESIYGLWIQPSDNDTGSAAAAVFCNLAGVGVGGIYTTATATSYTTSSDVRLKRAITPLTGALDVVRALRPVAFRWNADDSVGHGFLAHELQQTIPDAVTGEPDAINEDGSVKPQQVDHSRLVPWLTACCQELAAQVQALQARVASLEQQLGV